MHPFQKEAVPFKCLSLTSVNHMTTLALHVMPKYGSINVTTVRLLQHTLCLKQDQPEPFGHPG